MRPLTDDERLLVDLHLDVATRFIRAHEYLAAVYLRHIGPDEAVSELIDAAYRGLCGAVQSYSPEAETPFAPFAILCMKRAWIARYRVIRYREDRQTFSIEGFEEVSGEEPASSVDVEGEVLGRLACEEALGTLAPRQAAAMRCRMQGMDHRETAAALGVAPKTADNLAQLAVRNLRRYYERAEIGY